MFVGQASLCAETYSAKRRDNTIFWVAVMFVGIVLITVY